MVRKSIGFNSFVGAGFHARPQTKSDGTIPLIYSIKMQEFKAVYMEKTSNSPEETEKIAFQVGKTLKAGDSVCLDGELGAGKTAFTKGLAKALDVKDYITSPTFTIVNEYIGKLPMYHFDVYRIGDPEDMYEIGFEEYIFGDGVSIIEWSEKIMEILPQERINIFIRKDISKGENYREIVVKGGGY